MTRESAIIEEFTPGINSCNPMYLMDELTEVRSIWTGDSVSKIGTASGVGRKVVNSSHTEFSDRLPLAQVVFSNTTLLASAVPYMPVRVASVKSALSKEPPNHSTITALVKLAPARLAEDKSVRKNKASLRFAPDKSAPLRFALVKSIRPKSR